MRMQVLSAVNQLPLWEGDTTNSSGDVYNMVSRNETVMDLSARLACLTQGIQGEIDKFLKTFEPYAFLWQKDLVSEYATFLATNPDLEVSPSTQLHRNQCMLLLEQSKQQQIHRICHVLTDGLPPNNFRVASARGYTIYSSTTSL